MSDIVKQAQIILPGRKVQVNILSDKSVMFETEFSDGEVRSIRFQPRTLLMTLQALKELDAEPDGTLLTYEENE